MFLTGFVIAMSIHYTKKLFIPTVTTNDQAFRKYLYFTINWYSVVVVLIKAPPTQASLVFFWN